MVSSSEKRRSEDKWHLDKRVPLAIIVALVIQGIVFAYSYGVLNQKVEHNAKTNVSLSEAMPRFYRMETLVETMAGTLTEIKDELRLNRAATRKKDKAGE